VGTQQALEGQEGVGPEDKWGKGIPGREHSINKSKEAGEITWHIQERLPSHTGLKMALLESGGMKGKKDGAGLEHERIMTERNLNNRKPQGCLFTQMTTKAAFQNHLTDGSIEAGMKKGQLEDLRFPTPHPASWHSTPLYCSVGSACLFLPLGYAHGALDGSQQLLFPLPRGHSPAPALFVGHSVLLHEGGEPQQ
jgi:hypothetical protein